jgi:hypothetical protein
MQEQRRHTAGPYQQTSNTVSHVRNMSTVNTRAMRPQHKRPADMMITREVPWNGAAGSSPVSMVISGQGWPWSGVASCSIVIQHK